MSEHWTIREFFAFRESPEDLNSSAKEHLQQCRLCRELVDVVNYTAGVAQRSQTTEPRPGHFTGNSTGEILESIYGGTLGGREAGDFLSHLQACPHCFETLRNTLDDSLKPVTLPDANSRENRAGVSLAQIVLDLVPPEWHRRVQAPSVFERLVTAIVGLKPVPVWTRRLAGGLVILVLLSLAAVLLFKDRTNPYWDTLVYDQNVPYTYVPEITRGEDGKTPPLRLRLDLGFETAIRAYQSHNYEQALVTFAGLEDIAESLRTSEKNPATAAELRDFYFFWGLCHFALARNATGDFDANERETFLVNASRNLETARSLAREYDLSDPDRETYFIALSMIFLNRRDAAIAELQQIPPSSIVYPRSTRTLRELQRN